ncbi:MAG: Iron-binding zinc finger type [Marmoricola sp.]|nr:Iron-binding zinc finger type [Marmoricola sp.]
MEDNLTPAFDHGKPYPGADIVVSFEASRCRHFAECVRGLPTVFDVDRRPWIDPNGATPEEVADVVRRCPSGALQYRLSQGPDEVGDEVTSVERLETGQILLRGRLAVRTADEVRSETRMAACGCGASSMAPYCDGACLAG